MKPCNSLKFNLLIAYNLASFVSINTSLSPLFFSTLSVHIFTSWVSSISQLFYFSFLLIYTNNMKSLKIFLLLAMLMALAYTLSATTEEDSFVAIENDDDSTNEDENTDLPWLGTQETTSSLRGANRFLAQKTRAAMTCNKYPRVCRAKGSPGPDCCKKKCVNVLTDRLNCGMCGKKCKYAEICCKGHCVKPMSNKKHCGGCNNKCKKGNACVYGMCSYA